MAPLHAGAETINTHDTPEVRRLYWFKGRLNGQSIDCMLDSGATKSCIAKRCVTSSPILSKLPWQPYVGKPLVDANERPLSACHEIVVRFVVGDPAISLTIKLVIVDSLPY